MKTKITKCFVLLVLLGSFYTQVGAGVVFFDDFEGVNAVQWPDATQDADPVAQIGTWTVITENLQQDIQVSNNAVPGAASGSNFLSVFRSGTMDVKATFTQSLDASNLITVDYDVYFSSACPNGEGANFALRTGSLLNTLDVFYYSSAYGGFRYAHNGSNYLTPYSEGFAPDQWHHVNMTVDLATDTYSVTISGVTYANLALRVATDQLDYWWLSGNSVDSYFFMDNIVVAVVPEPCTILMLSIGGLLIKRRKGN